MNLDPKFLARNALEELGLSTLPIIPQKICSTLEIIYVERPLDGFEGTLIVTPSQALIGINESIRESGRKNFTCAHELGHYYMDVGATNTTRTIQCSKDTIETVGSSTPEIERRANIFASELLLPEHLIRPLLKGKDPGWDLISSIRDQTQTSLTATCCKFLDLTDQACALIVSSNQQVEWSRKSKPFTGWIRANGLPVSRESQAFRAFGKSRPAQDFEIASAGDWLSGDHVNVELELLEWSLPLNSYGQVLTLLWDEDTRSSWDDHSYKLGSESDEDDERQGPIWDPPTFHRSKRKR